MLQHSLEACSEIIFSARHVMRLRFSMLYEKVYNVMIVSLIVVSKETENKWHSMEIAEPLCFP